MWLGYFCNNFLEGVMWKITIVMDLRMGCKWIFGADYGSEKMTDR